tara:strand:+ start:215 stop:403 length:189 start_codon:yes stop_codon:yes gene_type:complete
MIKLIDKAIESLATAVIGSNERTAAESVAANPDYALKITQAISNLSHSKINLLEYDRMNKDL